MDVHFLLMELIVIQRDFPVYLTISTQLVSATLVDLDASGRPADTRTPEQKAALRGLVAKICKEYDIIELLGHRDTSPDLDGSGEVEPVEFIKACPCFDVRSEFSNFLRNVVVKAK